MVARAIDAKLQLAFDAPVTQAMVRTAPSHGGRVAVMAQTALVFIGREPLETERLLLEPIGLAHAEGLFEATVASRPELLPWMPWAKEPTLEGARVEAAKGSHDWSDGTRFPFSVVERSTGMVLGVVGLRREDDSTVELSYWIRSDHAGRGLTTEACAAVIEWAERALQVTRFTLWAGRENHASRRVAVKLAFAHVGPLDWEPDGGLGTFPAEKYELKV
jgi:RimJ/RimL family protein N-acetyltransferase